MPDQPITRKAAGRTMTLAELREFVNELGNGGAADGAWLRARTGWRGRLTRITASAAGSGDKASDGS